MSSLLNSLNNHSSCIRRSFRVLASSDNFVLLASKASFVSYLAIYHRSCHCYSVMCFILCNEECSFYRSYKSIKDLCNYIDILSSMLYINKI